MFNKLLKQVGLEFGPLLEMVGVFVSNFIPFATVSHVTCLSIDFPPILSHVPEFIITAANNGPWQLSAAV